MNYINHLKAVMERFTVEDDLNPAHVSLYLALFYLWNLNRFNNPLSVNRSEAMAVSRIGSKTTYHKCLKDLHAKGFIVYHPSHNPLKGSLIDLSIFGTSTWTSCGTTTGTSTGQVLGQVLVPSINNTINNNLSNSIDIGRGNSRIAQSDQSTNSQSATFIPPSIDEVRIFFENDVEAEKYFNYYSSKGWVVGNKSPMKDWKAAARNWKMNAVKFNSSKNNSDGPCRFPSQVEGKGAVGSGSLTSGHLNVDHEKDYSIPL